MHLDTSAAADLKESSSVLATIPGLGMEEVADRSQGIGMVLPLSWRMVMLYCSGSLSFIWRCLTELSHFDGIE